MAEVKKHRKEDKYMNQNEMPDARETNSEDDSVKKSRKNNLISFSVCVLIAFVIWLIIMNVTDVTPTPDVTGKAYEAGQSETL